MESAESDPTVPEIPRPLEALQGTPIPPFLSKTYDLVDDPALDPVISWAPAGESFVVWDPAEFSRAVLPRHFKHNNFSSFVRQLNTYIAAEDVCVELALCIQLEVISEVKILFLLGFHKIGTDRWEFANEDFLRGKKSLLKNINRRRSSQVQHIGTQMGPPVEIGKPGMDGEVQKLRREKDLLIQEVVQLKQEHLVTLQQMDALNQRLQSAELRQKQMVSFLAKVLQNPAFLAHLKKLKERREVASPRVRRKFLKQPQQQLSQSGSDKSKEQQIVKYRLGFEGDTSTSILQGLEHRDDKELPDYLLKNMVDKLGLDASEPDFPGCSSALMDPGTADLEENRKLMSQLVSSSGYFASLPEVTTTEEMLSCVISTAREHVSMADSKTAELSEESALKIEADATAGDSEYFTVFPENISQERLFLGTVAPASECINEEDIWNVDFQAGGSSFLAGDDAFTVYNAQEEFTAGPCALWELGLHTLDEDLEIDKYVGGESFNQERTDDAALQNQDLPKNREP